ncbi:MAG: lysine 2,3-aminomutase, partial [Clostridia bacterium]|nr:lysine 2,3-aminomutase [Clostridia bacterium]
YVISQTPRKTILRNFEGVITTYTEPEGYVEDCHCEVCRKAREEQPELVGVAGLEQGRKDGAIALEPKGLARLERGRKHD